MDLEKEQKYLKQLEKLFNLNKTRNQEIEKLKDLNKHIRFISKGYRTELKMKDSENNSLKKEIRFLKAIIEHIKNAEEINNVNNAYECLDILDF
jgi:seryl-tRNA synthetase